MSGNPPVVLVMGREGLMTYKLDRAHAIISIRDPEERVVDICPLLHPRGILRLNFHDVDVPKEDEKGMSMEMATAVARFVLHHKKHVEFFICQCEAGVSRSAGLAAAITKFLTDDDQYFFTHYTPNSRVYTMTLAALYAATN